MIRHCFVCGGKLGKQYVKDEKRRRLVCKKCSHITYVNPKVVAGLIPVMPDGRMVLLRRGIEPAYGRWSYPAGHMELGETVPEGAARETIEEIGVRVKVGELVGVYSYGDAGVVTLVYEGTVPKGELPKVTPEAIEVGYFRPSEIPWKDLAFRSTDHALKDWIKKNKRRPK